MTSLDDIAHFADVPISIEVQLGRVMSIVDILALNVDSVVRMNRSAGENMDIVAGGTLLGSGEIVIFDDIVGVRITDFNPEE